MESKWNGDNDWLDTARKKYISSLKNRFHDDIEEGSESTNNDENSRKLLNGGSLKISDCTDSQNFSLRLSDSCIINETIESSSHFGITKEKKSEPKTEVIIISDSSDEEDLKRIYFNKKHGIQTSTQISDLTNSNAVSPFRLSEVLTEDDTKSPRSIQKTILIDSTKKYSRYNSYISEESNIILKKVKIPNEKTFLLENKENSADIRTENLQDGDRKMKTSDSKNPKKSNKLTNEVRVTPRTTPLTKKDARNIAKIIKSKRVVYESPGQWKKNEEILNNSSSSNEDSKASQEKCSDKKKVRHPAWINETDSENTEIVDDKPTLKPVKPLKTHVDRFLNPISVRDTAVLSESKKEEISRWLMNNPLDSVSDTSVSYVPPTEQNSFSSGNSSLDRFELQHETPNNRKKFHIETNATDNNNKIGGTSAKRVQSVKGCQKTIDSFFRKVKHDDKNIFHPTPVMKTKSKKVISPSPPPSETSNLQIADCADILDKLYGDAWRDKADDLLVRSEQKKANPKMQNRAVQTECRKIRKFNKKESSSSGFDNNDNRFKAFVNDIQSNSNSTKKPELDYKCKRDSFINDNSISSESNGETSYQTALTTPIIFNEQNHRVKETPMTALTRKAIEICDSDSEDSIEILTRRSIDHRRRLSFSDDEIDLKSSPGTSEYDPDDILPPKTVIKPAKAPALKVLPRSATHTRPGLIKSFLASLSSSVPLNNAHPEAKKYRMNFKNTKEELCKHLYKLYNQRIFEKKLPDDMLIEWNVRMRGTAGFCYNKKKLKALGSTERSSRIVLSTKILDAPDRLRDTLVHEMCHAATWLINEVSDGHGPFWQAWASKAMKVFPELPSIKRCHDYKVATKYTYRCSNCGYSIGRHSKSLNVERKRCGHCFGKFELLINKTSKSGIVQVKTPIQKKPSGFALFVKENYHSVKKENCDVKHKEVMQILSRQFSAVKISNKNNNE